MQLLSSKEINAKLNTEMISEVEALKSEGIIPAIAIIRVGEKPDDIYYEQSIITRCEKLGIVSQVHTFADNTSEDILIKKIKELNDDDKIHGILLFKPLPKHLDDERISETIKVTKDIDGITKGSMTHVYRGTGEGFCPCTASAVIEVLKNYNIEISGKNVVVLGRSNVIGKPVSLMLLKEDATVTICHSKTAHLKNICKKADILVVAIGKAKFVDDEYVSEGQVVIDVGIHEDADGSMCGDVDFESVKDIVGAITPVPGGVGGITTSLLLRSVIGAAACR